MKMHDIPVPEVRDLIRFQRCIVVEKKTACWLWTASTTAFGYGRFSVGGRAGRVYRAHRLSKQWLGGVAPPAPDLMCMHECDNPRCVNPDHIRYGTALENARDMCAKGRQNLGDRNGSRTRPDRVPRGARHGSRTKPECIARGERHVSRTNPEWVRRGERHHSAKLTASDVVSIRAESEWLSTKQLSSNYGVSPALIRLIRQRKVWKHV